MNFKLFDVAMKIQLVEVLEVGCGEDEDARPLQEDAEVGLEAHAGTRRSHGLLSAQQEHVLHLSL